MTNTSLAPGLRVLVRDEEWLIRRVDPSSDGGLLLQCDGISDLVRGTFAQFLTKLEGEIPVLNPAETELVSDSSSHFNATFLYIEANLRRSTPNDSNIYLGHRAVMNHAPYQFDPALQALRQPRQRILIADAVGLGKTLEAGILTTELIQRGRGRRILVITLKSMLEQFQKEFWSRFTIPLVRLDSVGLQRVRNSIPSNHNPFNYYDRTIISVDTLKNKLEYRNYLQNAWWDIIIIDECHNVAARSNEDLSDRARLARILAGRSDTLIELSATPHDGSARSFASLVSLLDPTAISDPDNYTHEDFKEKGLVIRRFKKDIRDQVKDEFPERITEELHLDASLLEEAAFEALLAIPFTQKGMYQAGKQQELQRVAMQKAIFSSPFAALDSTENRIKLLRSKDAATKDEQKEIEALERFTTRLRAIEASSFSKFQRLVKYLLGAESGWNPSVPKDRLVIFSERIETLNWLKEHLPAAIHLKPSAFEMLTGEMADSEQQNIVDRFCRQDDNTRVLLCSDVASEGLNLHYFCHRLVHFDIPWSLMVFQQRNGRVDRYGQTIQPRISYLFTNTKVERIKGDLRILEILKKKDDQANTNLGYSDSFLNVFDPEKEAIKVAEVMASGIPAQDVEAKLDAMRTPEANEGDWLLELFNAPIQAPKSTDFLKIPVSIFGTDASSADYEFAKTALIELSRTRGVSDPHFEDTSYTLALTSPEDLRERMKIALPLEVRNPGHFYKLCANKERIIEEIELARQAKREENTWPELHYLWPQHPIMEWLADRVITAFGRRRAPVISSPRLTKGEQAFLLTGLIPNRKGQPMLIDWQVAVTDGKNWRLENFSDFAARAGLKANTLANANKGIDLAAPQANLPAAVARMRERMVGLQKTFAADMESRLKSTLDNLKALQNRQIEQIELKFEESRELERVKLARKEKRTTQVRRVFDEYKAWVAETMTTEPEPFIQVLAVVVHP